MAFTESTQVGFRHYRNVAENEVLMVAGDPGVTYATRSMLAVENGVAINATDSLSGPHYQCLRRTVCPAATEAFPYNEDFARHKFDTEHKCFVPVLSMASPGTPIFMAKIDGYADETIVSYGASTQVLECTTGFGANDRPNGSLVYIYEGPGLGEINIVSDYVHADVDLFCHRSFNATLTTSTKFIVLGSAAAAEAAGPGTGVDLQDTDEIEVDDGKSDGDFVVWPDWGDIMYLLPKGLLPIVRRSAII